MNSFIRHGFELAGAATLMAGALSACGGEPTVELQGQVQRYGVGIDVIVVEDQWVPHRNETQPPFGEIRNRYPHEEFSHCKEVDDELFSWNDDDFDCLNDFGWNACVSTDNTHCEAVYETQYDFERLEEVEVDNCPAPIRMREFRAEEPDVDQACLDRVRSDQRINKTSRYIVHVSVANPKHGEEGQQDRLEKDINLTFDEWNQLGTNRNVTVQVRGSQLIDVKI